MRLLATILVITVGAACGKVTSSADARPPDAVTFDARPDAPATVETFTMAGGWTCASGVTCEDVYDFDLPGSSSLTAKVTMVTGSSVPRLALFKGTDLTGTNLFTNNASARCGSQDTDLQVGPSTAPAGHVRVAVGRDWGASGGASGTYSVTITAAPGFVVDGQTVDDQASNQAACP